MGISNNFDRFMDSLTKDLEKWDNGKNNFVRKVSLACLRHLQKESPILTGRYKAAHTLSVDEPDGWLPDDLGPGDREATIARNTGLTPASRTPHPSYSNQAAERFADASSKLHNLEIKERMRIYLQNNLEYALHVEARDSVYGIVEERFNRFVKENMK